MNSSSMNSSGHTGFEEGFDLDLQLSAPDVVWLSLNTSGFNVREVNASELLNADNALREVYESFKADLYTYQDPTTIVLLILYALALVPAVIGNVLVMIVILGHRSMKCSTNYFLLNMAIADLLVALICIPVSVTKNVYSAWILGSFLCKTSPYLQGVAVTSGILTITALSKDRFIAIQYPMLTRKVNHGWCTKLSIAGIWVLSFLAMIPLAFVQQITELNLEPFEPLYYCQESWSNPWTKRAYSIFLMCFIYVVPGSFMVVLYTIMGRKLWKTSHAVSLRQQTASHRASGASHSAGSDRRRVARMSVIVAVVFALCWLPYYIFSTILDFKTNRDHDDVPLTALHFALWLGHANSAINPILYCFMGRTFRKKMINVLKILCNKKSNETTLYSTRLLERSSQMQEMPSKKKKTQTTSLES